MFEFFADAIYIFHNNLAVRCCCLKEDLVIIKYRVQKCVDSSGNSELHYSSDSEINKLFINFKIYIYIEITSMDEFADFFVSFAESTNRERLCPLFYAIKYHKYELLKIMSGIQDIIYNNYIYTMNSHRCNILGYAAFIDDEESVDFILEKLDIDLNRPNFLNSAFIIAIMYDRLSIAKKLVNAGAVVDVQMSLMPYMRNYYILEFLLSLGVSPNANPIDADEPDLDMGWPGGEIKSPLMVACQQDRVDNVDLLISYGADVNYMYEGETVINILLRDHNDNIQIFDALLNAGANLRNIGGELDALQLGVYLGTSTDILKRFVIRLSPYTKTGIGNTLIHLCVRTQQVDIETLNFLLGLGIDVNARNEDGKTALELIINNNGDFEAAVILLRAGTEIGDLIIPQYILDEAYRR